MKKQESKFIERLKVLLDPYVYVEKTYNPLRRGTPDLYIEGDLDIAWVEAKWIEKPWTGLKEIICDTQSWPLQKRWLARAHQHGKNALVVVWVGNNQQGYILEYPYTYENQPMRSLTNIAEFLIARVKILDD